ncbi:hypothetical protein VN12_26565 [Pirellula sp. SH-Sr6A]|uniref:hypothetical protein n=1 Tax=Pirellula sp. SH-Sr6A TaxID=1632865 RepID=UPI00078C7413|nr:hypothetical protein [Pirellula sp. SH-Sr6A]AMV35684.1 hypothetical protein VN12_26565 [Pirellula sp. SH-Sr6A]
MSKHSQGPFGLQRLSDNYQGCDGWKTFCIRSGGSSQGGNCLADVGEIDRGTSQWNEGNACLFAASPDLLQSLRELLEICRWKCSPNDEVLLPGGKTNHQAMIEAMEAIAKAEGA